MDVGPDVIMVSWVHNLDDTSIGSAVFVANASSVTLSADVGSWTQSCVCDWFAVTQGCDVAVSEDTQRAYIAAETLRSTLVRISLHAS